MNKIRKGDEVIILSGEEKGKTGKVLDVLAKEGKLIVEGCNMRERHRKKSVRRLRTESGPTPAPIPICKVALVSKKDHKPVRVHFEIREMAGKTRKVRVASRTGEEFD